MYLNRAVHQLAHTNKQLSIRKLSGTLFGSAGSFGNNPFKTYLAVFDGDITTHFDAATGDGGFCGIHFNTSRTVTRIRYYPRFDDPSLTARMVGGSFQMSNDQTNWQTIHTITTNPTIAWHEVFVNANCQSMRYLSPNGGSCNVSEIEFYGF